MTFYDWQVMSTISTGKQIEYGFVIQTFEFKFSTKCWLNAVKRAGLDRVRPMSDPRPGLHWAGLRADPDRMVLFCFLKKKIKSDKIQKKMENCCEYNKTYGILKGKKKTLLIIKPIILQIYTKNSYSNQKIRKYTSQ